MVANVPNMVRLAFQRSNFSAYYYVYLLLSSSILVLSAKCTIFFVSKCFFCVIIKIQFSKEIKQTNTDEIRLSLTSCPS